MSKPTLVMSRHLKGRLVWGATCNKGPGSYKSRVSTKTNGAFLGVIDDRVVSSSRQFSSLSKDAAVQSAEYDPKKRWMVIPPANLVHLSIGSVYAYSMWTPGMTHVLGVVSASAADWSHSEVVPILSAAAITLGITTATLGSWVEKVGPRMSGFVGSICWGSGLMVSGAGVYLHSLPVVYAGYSLLGGVGWGLMYLAPVTTVMKWFPDRRGLATGIALSAFGAGAAIAPAIIHSTMDFFAIAPDFIGPIEVFSGTDDSNAAGSVVLTTLADGSQVVADSSPIGEPGQPVVVATEADLAKLHNITTGPGAYALGSGDTGIAKAFGTLGVGYGIMGMLGSRFMCLPHYNWTPTGPLIPTKQDESPTRTTEVMSQDNATTKLESSDAVKNVNDIGLSVSYVTSSTRQFPLLWMSVFGNATGGLALLSSSKLMLTDIWAGVAPAVVTSSFATGYVSTLGIGMAVGRFGWSTLSDYLGRKNTYAVFGLGIPVVGFAPTLTHLAATHIGEDPSGILPMLGAFYGGSVLAITFYGGIFSTLPAYIADLFGQKHAGAIHGKLLTAWAASAVCGPMGLAYLRSRSADSAMENLVSTVQDKGAFEAAFGCPLDDSEKIRTLIDAKTITIGRLMEIVPPETLDPTPYLYDTTCYAAAGLMAVSFLANQAIRPLDYESVAKELEDKKKKERTVRDR